MATIEGAQVGLTTGKLTSAGSFEQFYRHEYYRAVALAFAITGDRAASEDVAQESFITAQQRWNRIGRYEAPGAWLRRVVTNRSISRLRRAGSESRAMTRLANESVPSPVGGMSADAVEVWEAVRALPKRQAQVIALTYLEGFTAEEVARILDCKPATAKTHLKRAKRSLARTLDVALEDS